MSYDSYPRKKDRSGGDFWEGVNHRLISSPASHNFIRTSLYIWLRIIIHKRYRIRNIFLEVYLVEFDGLNLFGLT